MLQTCPPQHPLLAAGDARRTALSLLDGRRCSRTIPNPGFLQRQGEGLELRTEAEWCGVVVVVVPCGIGVARRGVGDFTHGKEGGR